MTDAALNGQATDSTAQPKRGGWQPGQSGNPLGKGPDKLITDQLRLALNEYAKDGLCDESGNKIKNIRLVAAKLVERALEGDMVAIKECFDRIEGRPQQDVTVRGSIEHHIISLLKAIDNQDVKQIDGEATEVQPDTEQPTPSDRQDTT